MIFSVCLIGLLSFFVHIPPVLPDELTQIRHLQERIEEVKGRIAVFETEIKKRKKENHDEIKEESRSKDAPKEDKAALRKKIEDIEGKIKVFNEEQRKEREERGAQQGESRFKGVYLGLGWSHAEKNFDEGGLNTIKGPYGFEPAYTQGATVWGQPSDLYPTDIDEILQLLRLNAVIGYKFNGKRSLELTFDYLPTFYWEEKNFTFDACACVSRAKLSIVTIMAAVKYSPFSISDYIKPFFVVGSGWMYGELERQTLLPVVDLDISFFGLELFEPLFGYGVGLWEYRGEDSKKGLASKFGIGADVFVNDHFSISLETTYIFGEGDMDKIKYLKATAGITYHF